MPNRLREVLDSVKKDGLTTSQIIKESGVGRTSFYDILNGKQIPKVDTAYKISNALGLDITDVFPDINNNK